MSRRPPTLDSSPPPAGDSWGWPRFTSATAVAAEALRTGVIPCRRLPRKTAEIPREDVQNSVDEIGRAYGLQEEDTGVLRSAGEVLSRRDRHRSELRPPHRSRRS